MPELPEVETVARSLRRHVVGRTVERVETSGLALRRPVDRERLRRACEGARIDAVDRIGNYLLVRLSRGDVLVCHLGMSGRFLFVDEAAPPWPPHTHVVLGFARGAELRYVDARRFGVLAAYREAELEGAPELSVLGVDPLSPRFTVVWLIAELARSRRDIKQFLLDQGRIAGLGNIYASEALHEAGISPRRRADRLDSRRAARLHAAIRAVLERSVERRGTTLRDYVDADGAGGDNQNHLAVYGREHEPCHCGATIRRLVQGARSTFYCPRCQR
jgi:formamidopyrimidine-DNA glycosylase